MVAKLAYGWVVTIDQLNEKFTDTKIDKLIEYNLLHPIDPEDSNTMYIVGIIYLTCGRGDTANAEGWLSMRELELIESLATLFYFVPTKILFLDPIEN